MLGCLASGLLFAAPKVDVWITDPRGTSRFERLPQPLPIGPSNQGSSNRIQIDPNRRFQEMEGFGFTLTGGSAHHLIRMSPEARLKLLTELFGTNAAAIGVSYLRISVGASDLNSRVFTYDDRPAGETDPNLLHFDLAPEREELLPILRQILSLQPALKIMASPWTAPSWMKSNHDSRGGNLEPKWFAAYARYLVRYIREMRAEGIPIDALTVQNEPLNPANDPSMSMSAIDQAEFIKHHLGPAIRQAGLGTKIICYDHNPDRIDYPLAVLNDSGAKRYLAGTAFHLYAGRIEDIEALHTAHPDRSLYFTEQWIGAPGNLSGDLAWHVNEVLVGATRHWCRTVLEWNLAADANSEPHTGRGGCANCLGAVTLEGDSVVRNPAYYVIAHAAKFVRPGSVRIESTPLPSLPNVAFRTPSDSIVLIVLNRTQDTAEFSMGSASGSAMARLPSGAVGTYVWQGD